MFKKLSLVIVAVLALVMSSDSVSAAGESYGYEFSEVNFYTYDGLLLYKFTGLDTTVTYRWLLQGINDAGVPNQALAWKTSFGVSTVTILWSGTAGDFTLNDGTFYEGAARVIDSFGQELQRHYMLPGCATSLTACESDGWHENPGTEINDKNDRFVLGKYANLQSMNSDGYWHPYNNASVVTARKGDVTILHYRALTPSTDIFRIYPRNSSQQILEFSLAELVAYNTPLNPSTLVPLYANHNFIVLNTSGGQLPYINQLQSNAAFSGSFDNPMYSEIPLGAYDYKRLTSAGVNLVDGDSVLLVGNTIGSEWQIEAKTPLVLPLKNATFELRSRTGEIWSDGYITSSVTDDVLGVVDAADYAFSTRRDLSYSVGFLGVDIPVQWTITPTASNYFSATLAQRSFISSTQYSVLENQGASGRVQATLEGFGMNTTLGRSLGLIIAILAVTLFMAIKGGVSSPTPFYIAFMIIGGVWLSLGLGDVITVMIYAVVTLFMLFLMVRNTRTSSGEGI